MIVHYEVVRRINSSYWSVWRNEARAGSCATMQDAIALAKKKAWDDTWPVSIGWTNGDNSRGFTTYEYRSVVSQLRKKLKRGPS